MVRWAHRTRVRDSTRDAQHPELTSPLATKLAAGALAFGVVGGSLGAAGAQPVQGGAGAPPVVAVRSVPARTTTAAGSANPAPASAPGRALTHDPAVTVAGPATAAPSGSPERRVGPVLVTSYEDAARHSQDAPVKVQVGSAFVAADPAGAVGMVQDTLRNPRGRQ
ncbi:MAG: hypothetical protein JWP02_1966 [Acidimicrobiales bacterium]|nr:hypothetical protein [Acidimicrobiales bacterium]